MSFDSIQRNVLEGKQVPGAAAGTQRKPEGVGQWHEPQHGSRRICCTVATYKHLSTSN